MPLRPWNSVIKSGMKHIKVNGDYYHANFARFPESETISERANFLLFLMQNPKMHNRSPLNTHQTNEKKSSILLFIYVTTVCVCMFVCVLQNCLEHFYQLVIKKMHQTVCKSFPSMFFPTGRPASVFICCLILILNLVLLLASHYVHSLSAFC